jgi:pyruvate carboxylase
MRTRDLLHVAGHVSRLTPELLSMEAWGGATYDVALRFLSEDPWERLALLREAMPNIPLQMLLRGRNTVGYTPYPTKVTDAFVAEAASTGLDIFRIFDSLNDVSRRCARGRCRARHRDGGRRGRPVLHRQPARPR